MGGKTATAVDEMEEHSLAEFSGGSKVSMTYDSKDRKSPQTPAVGAISRGKRVKQTSHSFPQIQS